MTDRADLYRAFAARFHAGKRLRPATAAQLDDAEVDARVETQATLVGAESRVEFNTEATVDLHAALIVCPGHTENDLTF